jgi:hypothetical protein
MGEIRAEPVRDRRDERTDFIGDEGPRDSDLWVLAVEQLEQAIDGIAAFKLSGEISGNAGSGSPESR